MQFAAPPSSLSSRTNYCRPAQFKIVQLLVLISVFVCVAYRYTKLPIPATTTTTNNNDVTSSSLDPKTEEFSTTSSSSLSPESRGRYLPQLAAFDFHNKALTYQLSHCGMGRWGVRWGFENAGFTSVADKREVSDNVIMMMACNDRNTISTVSEDRRVNGKRLVSSIVGIVSPYCLGSGKLLQMKCRREFARARGCEFEQLGIQPATFVLDNPIEVNKLMALTESRPWVVKKSTGHGGMGITLFPTTQALLKGLKENERFTQGNMLAQEYVAKPALLSGKYKFDIRTWLLIVSVDPLVVFSRDGFGRVARAPFSINSTNPFAHLTNLDGQEKGRMKASPQRMKESTRRILVAQEDEDGEDGDDVLIDEAENDDTETKSTTDKPLVKDSGTYMRNFVEISKQLEASGQGFPPNFMQTKFRKQIDHAHILAALAQFEDKTRIRTNSTVGFFHLFACDSVIQSTGKVLLFECNGLPSEMEQNLVEPRVTSWGSLAALVLNYYLSPLRLIDGDVPCPTPECSGVWQNNNKMPPQATFEMGKYQYGGWRLIFNEMEMKTQDYDICKGRE